LEINQYKRHTKPRHPEHLLKGHCIRPGVVIGTPSHVYRYHSFRSPHNITVPEGPF